MDTLQELLRLLFRLGIALAIVSFIWFLVSTIYPDLSFKNTVGKLFASKTTTASSTSSTSKTGSSIFDMDWLPAPGSWQLAPRKQPKYTATSTNIEDSYYSIDGNSTNIASGYYDITKGYGNSGGFGTPYGMAPAGGATTTVRATSTVKASSTPVEPYNPTIEETRRLYVRNLSLYEGIAIKKGMTFTGEARNIMYGKDGKFKLLIIDSRSRSGIIGEAIATTDWTIAGWTRFTATVGAQLPNNTPCALIFESGTINVTTKQPLRFPYRVMCSQ